MSDPFEALREPVVPVTPDPSFAARLRERLTRAALNQGDTMAIQMTPRAPAWPPALTPYLVVSDARAALEWYTEVFGARLRGEPHVDTDGTIGHMEVDLGDAVLMFAEKSDLYPEVPVRAPDSPTCRTWTRQSYWHAAAARASSGSRPTSHTVVPRLSSTRSATAGSCCGHRPARPDCGTATSHA
jgi:hypothetical protein